MKRLSMIAAATACCLLAAACAAMPGSSVSQGSVPESSVSSLPSSEPAEADAGVRVGMGFVSTRAESSAATAAQAGNARFDVTACALCIDADGKILGVKFDTLQADVGFDLAGALVGDLTGELETKKELGDAYNMKEASGIKKEWYEQIAALEDWMRGKTVDAVLGMKVTGTDAPRTDVPAEEDLKTSVTISVADQLRALRKAYADAQR